MEYVIDTEGKKREALEVLCNLCEISFLKPVRFIEEGRKDYCCPEHATLSNRTGKEFPCGHCGKPVYRSPSKQLNSKSGLFFCNRECKEKGQSYIKEIQPKHYNGGINNYRKIAFEAYGKICNRCCHTDFEALVVHHIDRIRENNDVSNLEVLCANCHMKEHKNY